MIELCFRINVRNLQHEIEHDFLGMLDLYKRLSTFLIFNSSYSSESPPFILFEDPTMGNFYNYLLDTYQYQDTYHRVKDYFETLNSFEKEVFKDLTFYIDEIFDKSISPLSRNIVLITINRFCELTFLVKQMAR